MTTVIVKTPRTSRVVQAPTQQAVRIPAASALPPGQPGQVVGYGPNGTPQAMSLPDGTLPAGRPGQLVGYGTGGTPVAVDPPISADGGLDLTVIFDNQLI